LGIKLNNKIIFSPFRIKIFFLFPLLVGEGRERWRGQGEVGRRLGG